MQVAKDGKLQRPLSDDIQYRLREINLNLHWLDIEECYKGADPASCIEKKRILCEEALQLERENECLNIPT